MVDRHRPVDLDHSDVWFVNTSLDGNLIGKKPVFVKARAGDHSMSTFELGRLKDMIQQSHVFQLSNLNFQHVGFSASDLIRNIVSYRCSLKRIIITRISVVR